MDKPQIYRVELVKFSRFFVSEITFFCLLSLASEASREEASREEASREEANLTERKNPHSLVYIVKEFVCLS